MAILSLNIPDAQIPRIIEAIKPFLKEGDAIDIDNPTNAEAANKLRQMLIEYTKSFILSMEKSKYYDTYITNEISIT